MKKRGIIQLVKWTVISLLIAFGVLWVGGFCWTMWGPVELPVMVAAGQGDIEKVKTLLKQGRSINEQDPKVMFGWTPLISAINLNNTNMACFLIEHGADVNLGDKHGETPLMYAIGVGDQDVDFVKYLLAHGADLNVTDKWGATPLGYAMAAPARPQILDVLNRAASEEQKKSAAH